MDSENAFVIGPPLQNIFLKNLAPAWGAAGFLTLRADRRPRLFLKDPSAFGGGVDPP